MRSGSKWIKSESMLEERKGLIGKTIALKPRIEIALSNIENEVTKLAYIFDELKIIEMKIREGGNSYSYNCDLSRPNGIAHAELFESRRRGMTIIMSIISLEIVAERLRAVTEFREVVDLIAPTIAVMKSIRSALIRYVAITQEEIGEICQILEIILIDSCQLANAVLDFKKANQEAISLLNDAHARTEQKISEEFPSLTRFFSQRSD
jgi:hypothetical protein